LLFVSAPHTLGRGNDDLPQNVFVANDLQVITDVRGGWDEREQAGNKSRAADGLEQVPVAQKLRERDQVNPLIGIPQLHQRVVDRLVRGNVKVFLGNLRH